jgi:signal transduction histidine kinase/class 3 adenylate cyclase
MGKKDIPEEIARELAYYKRRVDELSGENLKLDYTISGLRHELKQKRQGFALLSELQQTVGAEKNVSAIFDTITEAVNSTLGMDRTVVLSPTGAEDVYRPTHWLGFREEASESLREVSLELPPEFRVGTGLVIVNKATEETPLIARIRKVFDLPFFICLPVMGDQGPIGILLSGRLKEARPLYPPFDQGDVDTFQAISGLVSAVVRNMRVAVLEEMDRLKTDFFANISHEFRTPISLTVGPVDQILAGRYGAVSEEAAEQLRTVRRNQDRLLVLVNQILDLARLEAGGMELRAAPIPDLNRFVQERAQPFRAVAEQRGVDLRLSLDSDVEGAEIFLDREKMDKVITNLLSNAVKFTREGHVEVATRLQDGLVRISVTDTGIGIKEDQLPHIFDRFRQADGSESREYAGSGIGLALVQEMVRLHGGSVTAFSDYGKGSTFRVTLPTGKDHLNPAWVVEFDPEDQDVPDEAAPSVVLEGATDREGASRLNERTEAEFDPDKPTVVYAEDNPDLRAHVRDLLSSEVNLFLAVDGRDGLEVVRKYRPEVVISDQMMPNMSGRDFLRALRDSPELSHTPVIFLTARAGTEARIESLEAGADDYLTKPFHEGELLARVRNLIRARRQERALAELSRRLEARVEEQMAELIRTGELKRFLPPAVAESIVSGQIGAGEAFERRKITVLAAELSGLAELTDTVEPEELSELVNDYLRELTAAAMSHGGTVNASASHQLSVIFGAPGEASPEEQAWAAVCTALEMCARVADLNATWRRRGVAVGPQVRVGINTGFCTVGVFGSDALRAYGAVGTPVTVAALLQGEAGPGEVLCGFAFHALVEARVRSVPRGELELRGVARPVDSYEILGLAGEDAPTGTGAPGPVFMPK